jgi:hypothetical protein
MRKNYQEAIYNLLYDLPLAYNPGLARTLGSVKAGILLGQMLYWQGKGYKGEWTYKTVAELQVETALSKAEQSAAIKRCKQLGVIETCRRGIPPVRHFRVNMERLIELIVPSQSPKTGRTFGSRDAARTADNPAHITENTTEKTPYSRVKAQRAFLERKRDALAKRMKLNHDR